MKKQSDVPLYSSRITNTYIEYLQKFHPEINIEDILTYAGMNRYEIEDPGHWFTQKQVDRFHEKVVEKSGNPELPREVGRFTSVSESAGAVKQYGLGLMSPLSVYLMVENFYRIMTRGATAKANKLGQNKVEITVTPKTSTDEKPYQCLNRKGTFESLAMAFTGKYAIVNETHCFHKGDAFCRYVIEWEKTPSLILKLIRNYLLIGTAALTPFLFWLFPFSVWAICVLSLISATLVLSSYSERIEKKELYNTIETQGNAAKELVNEINIRHSNALLIQEIGQVTSKIVDIDILLQDVMNIIMRYLIYDRGMIIIADDARQKPAYHTSIGYEKDTEAILLSTNFNTSKAAPNLLFNEVFNSQQPCLSNQTPNVANDDKTKAHPFQHIGKNSFICVPIVYEEKSLGILIVENTEKKKQLTQSDMSLLIGVASQVAVGIKNAHSFQKLHTVTEALQRQHDDLEIRVEERTAELEKLNQELSMEIAERLHSEKRLKAIIKEKDVLIREVHHRVKNNLQVTSSLLDMTKRRAKHPETADLLSEAHAKIFTMSLIHSQLYQSDRFDEINMGRFIRDLVSQLSQLYGSDKVVQIKYKTPDIYLSVTQAIPCALVVNEIISNAYKHAFNNSKNGRIRITLEEKENQEIHLNIEDDGTGIPDRIDIENTETLGIKLIRNLVTVQLKGKLQIHCTNGTEIDITFQRIKS